MKLAFIVDPLEDFKIYKDTTYAIMREAASRRHALYTLQQEDLAWQRGGVSAIASRLHLTGDKEAWYRSEPPVESALERFDAVLMRKDPPFDMEYVYSTYLLELAEMRGARIINRPRAIRDYNEKMAIARFPEFTAPSLVTRKESLIRDFLAEHRDIILKPLDGMGGISVFRVHGEDHNVNVIIETVTHYGRRTVMAQRFIPEIAQGDKRVILIDGELVPHCLARIPKPGESRGNLAAGARGEAQPVTARHREIAEAIGPQLAARGLLLIGLDVIGDWMTEINVTSPTGFREIQDQTGFDVAGTFIGALESKLQ